MSLSDMAQQTEDQSHDGLPDQPATEATPLIVGDPRFKAPSTPASLSLQPQTSVRKRRRVVALLCAFAFTMMLGDNLQPAALTQVIEQLICEDYCQASGMTACDRIKEDIDKRCKIAPVQEELALVRGYQQLVPMFAAILCSIPYGLLAERIGRKRVLILAGSGVFISFSWILLVCYYRFLPIRWIWLAGAFLFIGGGDAVVTSTIHIMVTDVADEADRAQIFLYLHAADVISGFFGPAVSAALMENGWVWSVLFLSAFTLFFGSAVITQFIPETWHMRKPPVPAEPPHPAENAAVAIEPTSSRSSDVQASRMSAVRNSISHILAPFANLFRFDRQSILLLVIFSPQTAARELFTVIGIQYSHAKFALPYARINILLSVFQAAQGVVVLVLLPAVTRLVADPRGWLPWSRDRLYAIVSMAIMAVGLFVIGIAPSAVVNTMGLLLVALASCTTGLLMSLLGDAVSPNQVAPMYGTAHMLSVITRSITAPVASSLLVKGMRLGRDFAGLPFITTAVLMGFLCVLGTRVSPVKPVP